jgi:NADH:ubiquinone oxidoreductase subunit
MNIGTLISVGLNCRLVGSDQYGNRYYLSTSLNTEGKNRRIVLYKGIAEPTKVPANWHSWLHYTTDKIPQTNQDKQPNLTGTQYSYDPKMHNNANPPYESWQPES